MKQLDLTKPVQTRDGRPVRILCTDAQSITSVVGLISEEPGKERLFAWNAHGRVAGLAQLDAHTDDLVNTPVKRRVTGWLNVYPDGAVYFGHKAKADLFAISSRIACIHIDIEYTEGDGLDGSAS